MAPWLTRPVTLGIGLLVGSSAPNVARSLVPADDRSVGAVRHIHVIESRGRVRTFPEVSSAATWVRHVGRRAAEIVVTDDTSGRAVSAEDAWFVRAPATRDRPPDGVISAFRRREDVERVAAERGGVLGMSWEGGAASDQSTGPANVSWPTAARSPGHR